MRRTAVALICAIIAPFTLAQPVAKTSGVSHTGQTQKAPTQMTTGAVKIGTVTAFNAGVKPIEAPSPIVVQSSPDTKPVSYMLAKKVRYVDKDGRAIDPHLIRPGTRVSSPSRTASGSLVNFQASTSSSTLISRNGVGS